MRTKSTLGPQGCWLLGSSHLAWLLRDHFGGARRYRAELALLFAVRPTPFLGLDYSGDE